MKWFRFYHEVLDDPKVQDLDPSTFKHWVNLLCLANTQEPRGTIPNNPRFVAFRLRVRDATAARLLAELIERGLLELSGNSRLIPHNWEKRQAKSDDSAPRVARTRGASPENNRVNVTAEPPLLKRHNSSLDKEEERDRDSSPTEKRAPAAPDAPSARRLRATLHEPTNGRPRDLHWETLEDIFGPCRTKPESDSRNAACKQFRDGGVSPEEMRRAAANWPNVMSDATCTPHGLAKHLGLLLGGPQVNGRSNGTTLAAKAPPPPKVEGPAPLEFTPEQAKASDAELARIREEMRQRGLAGRAARIGG